jgi:RNA polymerase sigma-70 factor (ECF subfamily)
MLIETDDTALLRLVQDKATRNEGFKFTLHKYSQPIYYFLRKMGLGHEDADELVQDVFVKFWRNPLYEEQNAVLKITLYRLATKSWMAYNLKHKLAELRGLTSEQLLIIVLKDQEELDFLEIAQITGITVNEVRISFKTGLEKLTN